MLGYAQQADAAEPVAGCVRAQWWRAKPPATWLRAMSRASGASGSVAAARYPEASVSLAAASASSACSAVPCAALHRRGRGAAVGGWTRSVARLSAHPPGRARARRRGCSFGCNSPTCGGCHQSSLPQVRTLANAPERPFTALIIRQSGILFYTDHSAPRAGGSEILLRVG